MEEPYIPFYKPYGMTDEEYECEVRDAERKYQQWYEYMQSLKTDNMSDINAVTCVVGIETKDGRNFLVIRPEVIESPGIVVEIGDDEKKVVDHWISETQSQG